MRFSTRLGMAVASLALLAGTTWAQAPLKIGVTPGPLADSIEVAAREARQQGMAVQVVEFTDWTTPNAALAAKDLDANYFQHHAFLDNAIRQRGYKFRSIGVGLQGSLRLYSARYQRLEDVPNGARLAIADDPANQTRALSFLRDVGLITLKVRNPRDISTNDIASNPRQLKFVEIPGPQLVRSFEDVDLEVSPPSGFVTAGRKDVANAALRYSLDDDSYWAIQFVSRDDNAADPRLAKFIAIYKASPEVRQQLHASYGSNRNFYRLAWLAAKPQP
ncbi:MAG: D-methionine-binding lipoprotein MetQ [Paracidovorax wautersii]|uniref:D-methionine-binding lipoprotein MetQ n=1 Tax=Paracidovorax wautersii TaxID=1177982 RepID=A0A7V8FQ48_9BURK|nr:MAG: D-methionine-binding lipoprotein MetQ [Paracidovorax wautersii]